jgi:uncharacterized protein YdeI (YjbR/CyaY-like superfamily)
LDTRVEQLRLPDDLAAVFDALPLIRAAFMAAPPEDSAAFLSWIEKADTPEEREQRIAMIIQVAATLVGQTEHRGQESNRA